MTKNRIRAAAAAVALTPMIVIGSAVATAAPSEAPTPVAVSELAPGPVEPAVLLAPFTLGLSLLAFPICFVPPILPLLTAPCVFAV
ncbi:hypothetical protein GCM10011610_25250 [Nocardia rhizosphaerihabitans]|uniref:Uncharacterized protein n=1 Tax=Nocardia rhizosphaerihabitans TaxID=1691570 RepID=A0ABQ2KAZ8_9NOCA|nr:hypothetical protein GCM10011610_25250 [Nocardia rhizosphaerihabitans]